MRRRRGCCGASSSLVAGDARAGCRGAAVRSSLRRRAHRHDRLDAVRQRRVRRRSRFRSTTRSPNGPHITLALGPPARVAASAIGVLFTNPGRPGRFGRRLPARGARRVPGARSATRSTSSRGIRAASARARRCDCLDNLDAFYAVDRDPRHARPRSPRTSTRAQTFVDACQQQQRATCCRTCRPTRRVRDLDAIRAAIGEQTDQLRRLLVRHVARRAVRRRVPEARAARWCSTARSIPPLSYADSDDRPGARASTTTSTRSSRTAEPTPTAASRAAAIPRPRTTISSRTIAAGTDSRRPSTASSARSGRASSTSASRARSTRAADGYDDARGRARAGRARQRRPDARARRRVHRPQEGREVLERDRRALRDRLPRRARAARRSPRCEQLADARAARVAPHFGASTVWLGLPCTFWPVPAVGKVAPIHAPGAPPILVVGTTARPRDAVRVGAVARARARQSGHLLTVDGDEPHRRTAAATSASTTTVDHYLLDAHSPRAGTALRLIRSRSAAIRSGSSDSMRIALPRMIL